MSPLKDFCRNRIQAMEVIRPDIRQAIIDVWDRWGEDGLGIVERYEPMLSNATYDQVKECFENSGEEE